VLFAIFATKPMKHLDLPREIAFENNTRKQWHPQFT